MKSKVESQKNFSVSSIDGKETRKISAGEVRDITQDGKTVLVILADDTVWKSPVGFEDTKAWRELKSMDHLSKVTNAIFSKKR